MAKRYRLEYTNQARKDLRAFDRAIARKILSKIEENSMMPDPLQRATALSGKLSGKYRYRIGSYRAVFKITSLSQNASGLCPEDECGVKHVSPEVIL